MKISIKSIRIIVLVLILFSSVFIYFRSLRKEVEILGFGYKKDIVSVKQSGTELQRITIDSSRKYKTGAYYFYKKFYYYKFGDKISLSIRIDSSNNKLLDTLIVLTNKSTRPVISLEDPTQIKFKRRLFVVHGTEKGIVNP